MRRPSDLSPDFIEMPSGFSSGGGQGEGGGAARLSRLYFELNRIDFSQVLEDGFRDSGIGAEPSVAGSAVVLDRRRDPALERFVERCKKKLRKAKDEVAQAMVLALLVSDTCGRSGAHASDTVRRHLRLATASRDGDTGELLLGDLLGDKVTGAKRRGKHPPTGAALVPHRALLFKALSDWLGLPSCTLERRPPSAGEQANNILYAASWNLVSVSSMTCVVDLLFDPGALYEEGSPKAVEYRRLLGDAEVAAQEGIASGGASVSAHGGRGGPALPLPPASRAELAGHIPRPPWHVEPWALDINRKDRIGRGGFGEVFHGRWAGTHVAIKEIKDATPTDAEVVDFMLEIALLSQLNHPNIVRFWRGCAEIRGGSRSLLMVTEYVKIGGLSRLLHGHGGPPLPEPLTLPQALSFALDIARGVQYLHTQRILHLDLKSPNVLVAPLWTAKLCDFGLAKIRGEHTMVQSTLQGVSPVWAPPEMFNESEGGLTEKADVYSFAVIFFELLTKRVPFQEVSAAQLPMLKSSGQLPQIPAGVPEDCADLIRLCCAAKPGARPSMSGVVARVKEVAQAHRASLTDVRPPTGLFSAEDGQEARLIEAEEAAAKRLVDLDGERTKLRTELNELQQRLEQVRRRGLELAAAGASAGDASDGGSPTAATGAGADPPGAGADPPGAGGAVECDMSWCDAFVQDVAGSKFRCGICSKLFRGPEFVRRHVAAKHSSEVRRAVEDAYFDCDVSREDALPAHASIPKPRFSPEARLRVGAGVGPFSQALQEACERGDVQQVASLLELRADPAQRDDNGIGPLAVGARSGHVAAVAALLDAVAAAAAAAAASGGGEGGAALSRLLGQTTGAGLTPLHMAASEGQGPVLSALLARNAELDPACVQGKTPLLHAGENGHSAACQLLLAARADAAAKTPDGETLLHVSARYGEAALIAQVVAWRADLAATDRDGWTPLHEASHWGSGAVEALLRAAAAVEARSRDGETPLHVALEGYEQAATCEVLLRWRADPQASDVDGESPLHVAARRNNSEACRLLLQYRAPPNAADNTGRRPMDVTRNEEVLGLLRASGAEPGDSAVDAVT
mmetsp:Transcript_48694/g.156439  ORF Transcript_48694/g.156439 Transcript_48694/m.156439 type:complete len:1083 (-) Transcript_48694:16-3264(-)